ncbi:MAG: hypothetical protein M3Y56_05805 [Armatimonadota bacterium]|nr:hypothetical protein [Armatimonadota bacterium]
MELPFVVEPTLALECEPALDPLLEPSVFGPDAVFIVLAGAEESLVAELSCAVELPPQP